MTSLAERLLALFPEWEPLVRDRDGVFSLRVPQPGTERFLSVRTQNDEVVLAFVNWRLEVGDVLAAVEIVRGLIAEERVMTVVSRPGLETESRLEHVRHRLEPERRATTRTYSWLRSYDSVVETV